MSRPKFVNRSWFFHLPREYRREHMKCCIDNEYCPVCGAPDHDCMDRCGCYERDKDAWRKANWVRMVAADPELAELEVQDRPVDLPAGPQPSPRGDHHE